MAGADAKTEEAPGAAEAPHVHELHKAITLRLKRATGHLKGVIAMIEEERDCLDIAQQLHAVEAAISQAKRTLIHDHLDHCLDETVGPLPADRRRRIEDFKKIARYL